MNTPQLLLIERLAFAMLFTLGCGISLWLWAEPEGGHKQDFIFGALFSGVTAISTWFRCFEQVTHDRIWWFGFAHWLATVLACGAAFYVVARYAHYVVTLVRSQREELRLRNSIGDAETEDAMLLYLSTESRKGLEATQARWRERGFGAWPPSASTGTSSRLPAAS